MVYRRRMPSHSLKRGASCGRCMQHVGPTDLSRHLRPLVVLAGFLAAPAFGFATSADPWLLAGRQGLVQVVIVPLALAADRDAYERQIQRLCDPERTCFINFYTNSTGATAGVPVPEAIAGEATATFRRSSKNGVQVFRWSCRMKVSAGECF
jgi:hypothetical protein